jgi:hypothetical protein
MKQQAALQLPTSAMITTSDLPLLDGIHLQQTVIASSACASQRFIGTLRNSREDSDYLTATTPHFA